MSKKKWQVTAKVSKLFSKLIFSVDFSAFASVYGFFSDGIRNSQLERAID